MDKRNEDLAELFEDGRRFSYKKEDVIIRSGDVPSGVYYIVSGWVKVYSLCKDGEQNIIMVLCPGDVFPIAWAVSGILRDINFAAIDNDTQAIRVSRDQFLHSIRSDKGIGYRAFQILADQFFTLANELDNLQYRSAREKVAFRLIFLASRFGKHNGTEVTIDMRVPNEYIARSTNMTRETASREISRLARKQLIRYNKGKITIPSLINLRNEIDQHFNLDTLSLE